jgi:hypothetical protein
VIKIQKKIVVDEHGAPKEAIIPWEQFCEIAETLGFDLDKKAQADLRATRRDLRKRKSEAFVTNEMWDYGGSIMASSEIRRSSTSSGR